VPPLLDCLAHADQEVRALAALALEQIGEPSVWFLLRVLRGDVTVLLEGHEAVGATPPPTPWGLTEMRCGAARVLARLHDPRALRPLIDALADREPRLRAEAARALGYQAHAPAVVPLLWTLGDEAPEARQRAAEALGRLAVEEIEVRPIPEEEADLVRLLSATLRHCPEEPVRRWAAWGLGRLGSPLGLPALRAAVRFWKVAEEPTVRAVALAAIARIEAAHQGTSGRELVAAVPPPAADPERTGRELSAAPTRPEAVLPGTGRELADVSAPT
jgi:HEAT repeat protein